MWQLGRQSEFLGSLSQPPVPPEHCIATSANSAKSANSANSAVSVISSISVIPDCSVRERPQFVLRDKLKLNAH